jgi:hypothetical protein
MLLSAKLVPGPHHAEHVGTDRGYRAAEGENLLRDLRLRRQRGVGLEPAAGPLDAPTASDSGIALPVPVSA